MKQKFWAVTLLALACLPAAHADWIDFEAQGANAPKGFSGVTDSPLVIGTATFTGGQLLKMS